MGVDEVEVEELRAAPAYARAVYGCDQDLRVGLQDLAKCAAGFDLLLNGRTAVIG